MSAAPGPKKVIDVDAERLAIKSESPATRWKTPVERAIQIGVTGIRMPTDMATLDEATRGGPLTSRFIVIGGAPGAGKTTLLVQLAKHYSAQGYHVALIASDEEADGMLTRWGQLEGIDRTELEEGKLSARKALAECMRKYPHLMLIDGDEEGATLENVSDELARRACGKPSVLMGDSIQTMPCAAAAGAENPRARTDAVVRVCKYAAKVQRHLVWMTSELSRGGYSARRAADRINSLAAFKESGGIEYGVTTALVMVNVSGEDDLVDVGIPKNRLGRRLAFRLKQNFRLCSFAEVPVEEEMAEPGDADEKEAQRIERARRRILTALTQVTTLRSKTAVCKRARGNRKDNMKAYDELLDEELILEIDGCIRPAPKTDGGIH